ncbi:hypothetical protein F4823DRAFT_574419 [Ustulina deusta]|nr:hypothetical protein F4823DRAFT_574419 [Ustulina deusta]
MYRKRCSLICYLGNTTSFRSDKSSLSPFYFYFSSFSFFSCSPHLFLYTCFSFLFFNGVCINLLPRVWVPRETGTLRGNISAAGTAPTYVVTAGCVFAFGRGVVFKGRCCRVQKYRLSRGPF